MKPIRLASTILLLYLTYGLYVSQYEVKVVDPTFRPASNQDYFDVKGVLNANTSLSIGSANHASIIKAAELAGHSFVLFTDLNQFEDIGIQSSYQGEVLSLIGSKYSYLDSRILNYSLNEETLGSNLGEVQIRLTDIITKKLVENANQISIIAHPKDPSFSWQGQVPTGVDGIEVLNAQAISRKHWKENPLSVVWSLLIYPFNSELSLLRLFTEPEDTARFWDQQLKERKLNGYAGTDATAKAIPVSGSLFKFPSYFRSFELMSNHLLLKSELTGNFEADRQKIFTALKSGQFYLAIDALGDPKGFEAIMRQGGRKFLMGSEVRHTKNLTLSIRIPKIENDFFEIILIRDGIPIRNINESQVMLPIEKPGAYRIQVRVSPTLPLPDGKKWISWIYSNPFYVK